MIQILLPAIVVLSGLATGCSKKPKANPNEELKAALANLPPRYFLSDSLVRQDGSQYVNPGGYMVSDMDRDGYMSPQDRVLYSTIDTGIMDEEKTDWEGLQALVQKLGHRSDRPLNLATAEAYLRFRDWQWIPGEGSFARDSLDSDMQMFYEVEDFAMDNGLEFSAEVYLDGLQEEYKLRYGNCGKTVDKGRFLKDYPFCEQLAAGLDQYFGSSELAELEARRQRILGSPENPGTLK